MYIFISFNSSCQYAPLNVKYWAFKKKNDEKG